MEKNSHLTWITNLYWKLEEISCVLVLRNKLWFSHVKPLIMQDIWNTIEYSRLNGYEQYAPKKNSKSSKSKISSPNISSSKCLIDIDPNDGNSIINELAIQEFTEDNSSPKVFNFSTETLETTSVSP